MDTRKALTDTMLRLLEKSSIEKISVTKLIEESGVSKRTFYRYYKDKYDLINSYYISLVEKEFSREQSWHDMVYKLFSFILDNRRYMKMAFKADGQNSFTESLIQNTIQNVDSRAKEIDHVNELAVDIRQEIIFYAYGSVNMLRYALEYDVEMTAEALVELNERVMPPNVRRYLL